MSTISPKKHPRAASKRAPAPPAAESRPEEPGEGEAPRPHRFFFGCSSEVSPLARSILADQKGAETIDALLVAFIEQGTSDWLDTALEQVEGSLTLLANSATDSSFEDEKNNEIGLVRHRVGAIRAVRDVLVRSGRVAS